MIKSKKILGIIICFAMMLNITSINSSANENSGGEVLYNMYVEQAEERQATEEELSEEEIQERGELTTIYNTILDRLAVTTYTTRSVDADDGQEDRYAEFYGGSYVDDDKLILCLTDEGTPDAFGIDVVNDSSVDFKEVKYSYNEILDFQDDIENKYSSYYEEYKDTDTVEFELLSSINGVGTSQMDNCIKISITDLTEEKIITFKKLFGEHDYIHLINTSDTNHDDATFKPGRSLHILLIDDEFDRLATRASMGYRAYWQPGDNKVYGFTSSGHGIRDAIDKKVYMGTNFEKVMGTVRVSKYSGSVDASFMKIASGHSIGTSVKYSDENGNTTNTDTIVENIFASNVPENQTVIRVGSTTYRTKGVVIDTNYTWYINNVTFKNLTQMTNATKGGDSGGIVYTYNNFGYMPCGLVKGHVGNTAVYTKADRVLTTISIHPY